VPELCLSSLSKRHGGIPSCKECFHSWCSVEACNRAQWQYSPYGSCSAQCGGGLASRTAICRAGDSFGAPDVASCNATVQPAPLTQACNPSTCSLHVWTVGSWGPCDATCGGDMPPCKKLSVHALHHASSAARSAHLLASCSAPQIMHSHTQSLTGR